MADTAILEATAEQEHKRRIAENYRRLLHDLAEERSAEQTRPEAQERTAPALAFAPAPAPVATATLERAPVMPVHESVAPVQEQKPADYSASAAQRISDYVAYAPAKGKRMLFDDIALKDGEIVRVAPPAAAAPAAPAVAAPVEIPAAPAVTAPAEEDALPTRRTLETLHRGAEATETEERSGTGLLSALSLKTKLVLCAIAAAVVLIIALICVNTGILSSANADIVVKEAQLRDLQTQYAQMQEEIDYLQSDEYIDAWAQQNGMVRGE